jgi:hypothetical protein
LTKRLIKLSKKLYLQSYLNKIMLLVVLNENKTKQKQSPVNFLISVGEMLAQKVLYNK